jgi:type IV pilus assembly protein PilB
MPAELKPADRESDPPKPVRRLDLARELQRQVAEVVDLLADSVNRTGNPAWLAGVLTLVEELAMRAEATGFPSVAVSARGVNELAAVALAAGSHRTLQDRFAKAFSQLVDTTDALVASYADAQPVLLIIDSSPASLAEEAGWLQVLDCEVLKAGTGAAGLRLAQERHPDLILLDVNLADGDGFEVCYHLQHDGRTADVPVVILTARNGMQDHDRAFAVGASAFVEKPVTATSLTQVAKQYVHRHQERRAALRPKSKPAPAADGKPGDYAGFLTLLEHRLFLSETVRAALGGTDPQYLPDAAVTRGIPEAVLAALMAEYCGLPLLATLEAQQVALGVLPVAVSRQHLAIPLRGEAGALVFAVANPFDAHLLTLLDPQLRRGEGALAVAPLSAVRTALQFTPDGTIAREGVGALDVDDIADEITALHAQLSTNVDAEAAQSDQSAPLVRLVHKLMIKAHQIGASDIHIEPTATHVLVRFRVDGALMTGYELRPARLIAPLVSRLKVMAGLNLSERRLPQDGRIALKDYTQGAVDVDMRVSTIPVIHGESVVMRLLDHQRTLLPLDMLGFSPAALAAYERHIRSPYGMVLHVGPTGSGKSMTLYAALNAVKTPEVKIITAEDPIEYTLDGINQLQVKPAIGLDFARSLRSFLRQDPDIILVGEIRDRETADVAVEAAMTGHLLLSTLHTNDAASAVVRLIEMGVEPFLVSSTLMMVCAQRLVRRLCLRCREPVKPEPPDRKRLGTLARKATLYRPVGCPECRGTGYKGRIGLYEVLIPDEAMRAAIARSDVTAEALKRMAVASGMTTLYWDAMEKVAQGNCGMADVLNHVLPDEFDSLPSRLRPVRARARESPGAEA